MSLHVIITQKNGRVSQNGLLGWMFYRLREAMQFRPARPRPTLSAAKRVMYLIELGGVVMAKIALIPAFGEFC